MDQDKRPPLDREEPELAYEDDIPTQSDEELQDIEVDDRKAAS